MKWFIVEGHLDKTEALAAARVPATEITIAKPRAIKGLAFPEQDKAKALEILGLSGTDLVETGTDHEGVYLLEVRQGVVLEASSHMEAWDEIEAILQEYAELLGVKMFVSNPHGTPVPARTETGKLFLRFWSTPGPIVKTKYPEIFGFDVSDGQRDGLEPSGQGVSIQESDGLTVAEVVEGTLYVLFDLPHSSSNAAALIRAIMEQYLLLQKSPEERERRLREATEREQQRSREAYVRECGRRLQSTIAATRKSIEQAQAVISDAQQRITEAVRAESGFRKKLEQLLNSQSEAERQFAEEFEKLSKVPGIRNINVRDGIISIFTEQVDIEYKNLVYDIGLFKIDIYTDGKSGGVRCFNLTRTIEGYYHPHIEGDGRCCLGNISDGVAKLIGEYQYSVLAQIMLQYLRTVNSRDWYRDIKNWPVREPAGKGEK